MEPLNKLQCSVNTVHFLLVSTSLRVLSKGSIGEGLARRSSNDVKDAGWISPNEMVQLIGDVFESILPQNLEKYRDRKYEVSHRRKYSS